MMWRGCRRLAGLTLAVVSGAAAAGEIAPQDKKSGSEFMAAETRRMQADEVSNPGMLWVQDGERLWKQAEGPAGATCQGCHGDASQSMRGAAARYPAFDAELGRPIDLSGRINRCRETRQSAKPLAHESAELLALTAYVARQSLGMAITPPGDKRLVPFREKGEQVFEQRMGQLDLSCASCHDDNWGKRLGGSVIPQAHPTGYPLYRLEWQTLGSLQRRLRGCMVGVRAEPFDYDAPEFVDLELYLMSRAEGLVIETPGVRP